MGAEDINAEAQVQQLKNKRRVDELTPTAIQALDGLLQSALQTAVANRVGDEPIRIDLTEYVFQLFLRTANNPSLSHEALRKTGYMKIFPDLKDYPLMHTFIRSQIGKEQKSRVLLPSGEMVPGVIALDFKSLLERANQVHAKVGAKDLDDKKLAAGAWRIDSARP